MNSNKVTYGIRSCGKLHGDVFTKPEVVKHMLDLVGYVSSSNLSLVSVLEPSCGEGEFLVEIIDRLWQSSINFNFDFNEAFHKCITAIDIDSAKTKICIERITSSYSKLDSPERNILTEDFLLSNYNSADIVIGNPPYIRYEEIPKDKLLLYKKFSTFFFRSDIYIAFFEKSLSLLKPNGKHCFICSNRWMRNKYGKKLRLLIARYYDVERIVNMENADAFQDEVLAYPAITLIRNSHTSKSLNFADIDNVAELNNCCFKELNTPKGDDWSGVFNSSNADFSLIEEQNFKIGIGIATGADGIFISKDFKGHIEDELLVPVINARDLSGNQMCWNGNFFLNPYDNNGELICLDNYPKARLYFEQHKEKLSARHKARKNPSKWYGIIDTFNKSLITEPKILLPDISGNSYIFVDSGNYYPQHNIYYILGNGEKQHRILAALLMSDFVRLQLDNLTNHMNGGFARWQSQYLRKIRIPTLSNIPDSIADNLLKCYEDRNVDGINYFTSEIVSNEKMSAPKLKNTLNQPTQLTFSFDCA